MRLSVIGVVLATLNSSTTTVEFTQKDLVGIQGTWVVVSMEMDEKESDAGKGVKCIVKKDIIEFVKQEQLAEDKGSYTLVPTAKPKRFEASIGIIELAGIYELEGDSLRLCFIVMTQGSKGDEPRPTDFKTEKNSGKVLVKLRRETGRKP